jgi:hypothetical protein
MGTEDIAVDMEVEFIDALSTDELEAAFDRIERGVKAVVSTVTKMSIEAQSLKNTYICLYTSVIFVPCSAVSDRFEIL